MPLNGWLKGFAYPNMDTKTELRFEINLRFANGEWSSVTWFTPNSKFSILNYSQLTIRKSKPTLHSRDDQGLELRVEIGDLRMGSGPFIANRLTPTLPQAPYTNQLLNRIALSG
jgi:hypothetical protein